MRRALAILKLLCGWLVLYIAVGGLLSFAFSGPYRPELGCVPHSVTFGGLESGAPIRLPSCFGL